MTEGSWVNPKLEVRPSPMGGRGVFAKELIRKGELLTLEVAGQYRVINTVTYLVEVEHHGDLAYNIGPDQYAAPLDPANPEVSWLVNHSCEPNTVQTADDNLVAWHDIEPDKEVTYDYATTEENTEWQMECRCGSKCCRRLITGNDWLLPGVQEKYAGHFTRSLEIKIAKERANRDCHLDW